MPAWLLLDKEKRIVASVRAKTADEARGIFKASGLKGSFLRKG